MPGVAVFEKRVRATLQPLHVMGLILRIVPENKKGMEML